MVINNTIILSVLLTSLGLYTIFMDNDFLMGFIYLSLGFSISVNDWIKIFKSK